MSLPTLSGIVSSISLRIQNSRESLRSLNQKDKDSKSDSWSLKSNDSSRSLDSSINNPASIPSHNRRRSTYNKRGSTSYYPYTVYEQAMSPPILRNAEATRKLLETIHELPGGKRSVARLARTCRALKEPALSVLWADLDSVLPLIGLFPANIMKRARRPALGLNKMPVDADWKDLLEYGERVRRITYEESAHNIPTNIFPVFEDRCPRSWILPNLTSLVWRCETPTGLDRARIFLNPQLKSVVLEVGTKFSNLSEFLALLSSRTRLREFSITSPSNIPDDFTQVMKPQDKLEKLSLMAPEALSSKVGKWVSGISTLRTLELDFAGKPMTAVEGFFDEITPRSGATTPSSVGSRDSGVFSADELDFTEIRKSAVRITGDVRRRACGQLRNLQLTGEAGTIAMFLKHLAGHIHSLELIIEDPPEEMDWQDLCTVICEQFWNSLKRLKIGATGSSRFVDLARSTSRMSSLPLRRLPLQHLTALPKLTSLEIDLPLSVIFENSDLQHLAKVCPDIEVLRLCPVARYPTSSGPELTLEGLAPLTAGCKRLHTLAVVVNATPGSEQILHSRDVSSKSLFRLHVGHSHLKDPLQAAILLSHIAPSLDNLKWLQERTRSGSLDMNTGGWQKVCELLPHLQNIRLSEKRMAALDIVIPPQVLEKGVDATVLTVNSGVQARPGTAECSVQFSPILVEQEVGAVAETTETSIDATPSLVDVDISATPTVFEASVNACPSTVSRAVGVLVSTASKCVEAAMEPLTYAEGSQTQNGPNGESSSHFPDLPFVPSIRGVVYFPIRVVRAYTYYITLPLRFLLSSSSLDPSSEKEPIHQVEEQDQEKVALASSLNDVTSTSGVDSVAGVGDV